MHTHPRRTHIAIALVLTVFAALAAAAVPGTAQSANPLPGVWYGADVDADGARVVAIVFGTGPASSMPYTIVDTYDFAFRCPDGEPEIVRGTASLADGTISFGAGTRYCADGSTVPQEPFTLGLNTEDIPQIDSAIPGEGGPVSFQKVCPRDPDFFDDFLDPDHDIVGSGRPDRLVGTAEDDVIDGLGNNDTLLGRGGNDIICAGGGNDAVRAGGGVDIVWGDRGADVIVGMGDSDVLYGGGGNDQLKGNTGRDFVYGEAGRDSITGQGGNDLLDGGAARDRIRGGQGRDLLLGAGGNDVLLGNAGRDVADGQAGRDRCVAEVERNCER